MSNRKGGFHNNPVPLNTPRKLNQAYYVNDSYAPTSTWKDVSVGKGHVLALDNNNKLWAWGRNADGQLGFIPSDSPETYNRSWIKISSNRHTVAMRDDGTLWAWGYNNWGQLGDNTTVTRSSPVQVLTNQRFVDFAVSTNSHTVALAEDGSLWAWGLNNAGQLGTGEAGTPAARSMPVQVLGGNDWVKFVAGTSVTMAIKSDGSLWTWGRNDTGGLGTNDTIWRSSPVQIGTSSWAFLAAGSVCNFAIDVNSRLFAWGNGDRGRTGLGDQAHRSSPVQIGSSSWSHIYGSGGKSTMHAIRIDGTLWGWGIGDAGRIGDGTINHRSSMVQIGSRTDWKYILNGHSDMPAFMTNDGDIFVTGANLYARNGREFGPYTNGVLYDLGQGFSSPVQLGGKKGPGGREDFGPEGHGSYWKNLESWNGTDQAKGLGIGNIATQGIRTYDGQPYGWGYNVEGTLGNGGRFHTVPKWDNPAYATGEDNPGWNPSTAVGTDFSLRGPGDTIIPQQVMKSKTWKKISAGATHSMAIDSDNKLWGWGAFGAGDATLSAPARKPALYWNQFTQGTNFTIAIKNDGTLWGWGLNNYGQLGIGDTYDRSSPVQITSVGRSYVKVVAGDYHVLATDASGRLYAWGRGSEGQLGPTPRRYGSGAYYRSNPVQMGALDWAGKSSWVAVSAGRYQAYGIPFDDYARDAERLRDADANFRLGRVYAWGENAYGTLGTGDTGHRSSPVNIAGGQTWRKINPGISNMAGIYDDYRLYLSGRNDYGQVGDSTILHRSSLTQIPQSWVCIGDAMAESMIGVRIVSSPVQLGTNRGELFAWGRNTWGGLGLNDTAHRSSPVQIGTDTDWVWAATRHHSFAIKENGTLWAWGQNTYGNLGLDDIIHRSSPVQIGTDTNWSFVTVMAESTAAIKTNGTLWVWGRNNHGQLGLNDIIDRSSPVQIGSDTDWVKVQPGFSSLFAVKSDGTCWGWGRNDAGQLGLNDINSRSEPVQIPELICIDPENGFSARGSHLVVLGPKGTMWVSGGYNQYNNHLGFETNLSGQGHILSNYSSPIQIGENWNFHTPALRSQPHSFYDSEVGDPAFGVNDDAVIQTTSWTNIAAGNYSSYAINNLGQLWAWGHNNYGQLGQGNTTGNSSPVQILSGSSFTMVSAGGESAGGITIAQQLYTWGRNDYGQLALTNTTNYSTPQLVPGVQNWENVSIGWYLSSLGLRNGGKLFAWGLNNYGQMGDGTVVNKSSPVQIGASNWSQIYSSTENSAALTQDGRMFMWGRGLYGSFGLFNQTDYSSPVQVGSIVGGTVLSGSALAKNTRSYTQIGSRNYAAGGIDSANGLLYMQGTNTYGQVAPDGYISRNEYRSSPVQVGLEWALYQDHPVFDFTLDYGLNGEYYWSGNKYRTYDYTETLSARPKFMGVMDRQEPKQIGNQEYSKVSAGDQTTVAITRQGALYGWGLNRSGQVGNGQTFNEIYSPIQIGSSSWTNVSTGNNTTYAISSN